MLTTALFASGPVGTAIARLLLARDAPPALAVLDEQDPGGCNSALREVLGEVEVHEWTSEADSASAVRARLRELHVDVGLLAWWPRILRQDMIDATQRGFLNCHPSLLPHGRGKDPNFWAIVEGSPFGVTLHYVDSGVDTGPVAFQEQLPVTWEDTGGSLYERALDAMVALVDQHLDDILSGQVPRRPQDPAVGSFHMRKDLEPASWFELDAPTSARELLNLLRARTFRGHPAARFTDDGVEYEVRVEITRTS